MRSISKVLVMGAVASACGYAAAGTVGVPASVPSFSRESAAAVVSSGTITNLGAVGGVGPTAGGLVTGSLTFATDSLAASTSRVTFTSNVTFGSVDQHAASFTCSAGPSAAATSTIVFQLSSTSNSSAVIYDAAQRGAGSLVGASCVIPNIGFLASSFAAASSDISLSGTVVNINTGFTLDTLTGAKIASVGSTMVFSVASSLDAVIDVQSNRLTFASGVDNSLVSGGFTDNFTVLNTVATARNTVGGQYASSFALTLTAGTSFAFLQDPAGTTGEGACTATTGSGRAATGTSTTGNPTPSLTPTSGACNVLLATFNTTTALPAGTYTVGLGRSAPNVNTASASQFAPQSYTYSYSLTSGNNVLATGAAAAAGSWTLNGTTVTLQYIPVATDTNLQVLASNTTSSAGTLTFVAYNSAGSTCTGDLGAVGAAATSSFGGQLRSALLGTPAAGTTTDCSTTFIGSAGRAAVVLTSTTPSSGTRFHTGFSKSDGVSRQIIVNSGN